jgi:hypothetical protein
VKMHRASTVPRTTFHRRLPFSSTSSKKSHRNNRPRFSTSRRRRTTATIASARDATTNWSNATGESVREIIKDSLFVCERAFVWNSIDVGGRCAVVKMKNGELWVHSPIDLDEETKRAIDGIGVVKHIVSPNYEHVKYAVQWKRAYPDAILWGCPGLKEKKKGEIPYDRDLGEVGDAGVEWREMWLDEFEMVHWDCESVLEKPFFNEVSFVHKESKCLMVTDVYWNYPDGNGMDENLYTFKEKGWKFLMDVIYLPIYKEVLCFGKKEKLRARVEDVERLDFDTIVPCHGTIVTGGGVKSALRKHLL